MAKYEDYAQQIDAELQKQRHKWQLYAISWMNYEDLEQIIRLHIFEKFDQYDPARPIERWINTIARNQRNNIIRNIYLNHAKPCVRCPASEGNDLCAIYTKQCSDCPIFARWAKNKKSAFDTKLPVPIENHQQEVFNITSDKIDVEQSAENLHIKMKSILRPVEWKIYNWLYIQHKTEEQVAKLMHYKTTETNRRAGYNTIRAIKKKIIIKAKKVLYSGDVDFKIM